MKHILIDYENVYPQSLEMLADKDQYHLWLFLGVDQQKSLSYPLVKSLLCFDSNNIHFIEMQTQGKNALDHYLSFYLGKISELDKKAQVFILSKDKGYDVLLKHLHLSYHHMESVRVTDVQSIAKTKKINNEHNINCSRQLYPDFDKIIWHYYANQNRAWVYSIGFVSSCCDDNKFILASNTNLLDILKQEPTEAVSQSFITWCFQIALSKMNEEGVYLPRLEANFKSALRKYALDYEARKLTDKQVSYLINKVYQRFIKLGLIVNKNGKLTYKISQQDLLDSIKEQVVKARQKKISCLRTQIINLLRLYNQPYHPEEVDLVLRWLKRKQILRIENDTVIFDGANCHQPAILFDDLYQLAQNKLLNTPKFIRPKSIVSLKNWLSTILKHPPDELIERVLQQFIKDDYVAINHYGNPDYLYT